MYHCHSHVCWITICFICLLFWNGLLGVKNTNGQHFPDNSVSFYHVLSFWSFLKKIVFSYLLLIVIYLFWLFFHIYQKMYLFIYLYSFSYLFIYSLINFFIYFWGITLAIDKVLFAVAKLHPSLMSDAASCECRSHERCEREIRVTSSARIGVRAAFALGQVRSNCEWVSCATHGKGNTKARQASGCRGWRMSTDVLLHNCHIKNILVHTRQNTGDFENE